jgi:hypothetical protein
MTEKPEKQRRQRGVILTPTGLEKLLAARQEAEYRDNRGHRFTLEVLSEKTLLGVDTLMKVFACESGVDKQTLRQCFQAFNLTLETGDYHRPNLLENNPINPHLLNELPEGQVPLDSPFYIERNNLEKTCYQAILRGGSLIRITAPRRMGKTSLMTRVINYAQQQEYQTIYLSFQLAESSIFQDLNHFLRWICASITRELDLENHLQKYWDDLLGRKINCKIYLEKYILSHLDRPLVIAFDDIEYLFPYPQLVEEFFSLLHLWHEEGKNKPLWQKLRLIVAYSHSQEVYQPLDTHQSPFSLGLPIELPNFTSAQVQELSQRYGLDKNLNSEKLQAFLGGNPYLIRLACYHIAQGNCTLEKILATSVNDDSNIFEDHLKRLLWHLQYFHGNLADIFAKVVMAEREIEIDLIAAFQLQSLSLIHLQGKFCRVSCPLYHQYFGEYFAQSSIFLPRKTSILGKKIPLTHFDTSVKNRYAM